MPNAAAQSALSDDQIAGQVLRIASWVARGVWAVFIGMVVAGFLLGAYLATIESDIKFVKDELIEFKSILLEDYGARIRNIEHAIAPGVLEQAKDDIRSIREDMHDTRARVRVLETHEEKDHGR